MSERSDVYQYVYLHTLLILYLFDDGSSGSDRINSLSTDTQIAAPFRLDQTKYLYPPSYRITQTKTALFSPK